jgi:adenylosuccinate synthase
LKNNEEETCTFNEFQKDLRFGDLDYDLLNYALKTDEAMLLPKEKSCDNLFRPVG